MIINLIYVVNAKKKKISINNIDYIIKLWDTAGQEKFKALTKFFYKDAAIVILVYDITRRESFDNLKNYWYNQIKENTSGNLSK